MAPHPHHRTTLKHQDWNCILQTLSPSRYWFCIEALPYICCHRHRFISFLRQLCGVGLLLLSLNERKQGSEKWHGLSKLISDRGFPGDSVVENPPANAGDVGSILGSGRSLGEEMAIPAFLPGKSHGKRILAGYSPWGCKSQTWFSD